MDNNDVTQIATPNPAEVTNAGHRLQLGLRLQPVNHSDQPVYSNFTAVQGAPGTVFLDFGFLDPGVMPALARQAQSGAKVPQTIEGRLACRIAIGIDVAAQLAQQLEQHLRTLRPRGPKAVDDDSAS